MIFSMHFDMQFDSNCYVPAEIEHQYGNCIHILKHPFALSLLAKLCAKETTQPEITRLVTELYRLLVTEAISAEFPQQTIVSKTRMHDLDTRGLWQGNVLQSQVNAVVVSLARAGLLPSQITYDFLNHLLNPQGVRQDHLVLGRTTDAEGRVVGAGLYASKIGGSIENCILIIPDPMGATGSTVGNVLQHYAKANHGKPSKILALHLIITPEYLRFLRKNHPEVHVYALRLDRGLSPEHVLKTTPGTHWELEQGLSDKHYIIPGAGGLGEILNNSFV